MLTVSPTLEGTVMTEFATYAPGLLLAFTALTLALLSPGPSVLAILGVALGQGRKSAVAMAFGVGIGSTCWALLTVLGLSALIAVSATALIIIKIAGGGYLLWLAYKSFRAATLPFDPTVTETDAADGRLGKFVAQGLAIHLTNPKAAFAWVSIAALGMQPGAPAWVGAALVCGAAVLSCGINAFYALAFSTKSVFDIYLKARRGIQFGLGPFFTLAGLKLITSRV